MKEIYKPHAVVLADSIKVAFMLLAAPLLTDLVKTFMLNEFKASFNFEVCILLIVLLVSFLRFKTTQIIIENNKIIYLKGFLVKIRREIPVDRVLSVSLVERPVAKLFSACQVYINTVVAERRVNEIKIILRKADAQEITEIFFGKQAVETAPEENSKTPFIAALSSSAIVGLVMGIPIISKIAALFCKAFVSQIEKRRLLFDDLVVIGGTRWLSFRQIYCKKNSVCEIKLSQNFLDKKRNTCTLKLTVKANRNKKAKIRRLNRDKCFDILQKNYAVNE